METEAVFPMLIGVKVMGALMVIVTVAMPPVARAPIWAVTVAPAAEQVDNRKQDNRSDQRGQ